MPAEHAFIMVWDGLRPDYVSPTATPILWDLAQHGVWFERSHAVLIGSRFGDITLAAAVTAVIENKNIDLYLFVQQFDILDAVADVARITMKPHERHRGVPVRNKPSVETDAVSGGEEKILEFQPNMARGKDYLGAWIEN